MSRKLRIGDFGRALAQASRENRSAGWLKAQLDVLYTRLREQQNHKKQEKGIVHGV